MLILGDEKHAEAVKALRKQAKENQEILACGLDLSDDFLGSFIRGKNGDQKKAFKTLQNYVSVRKGKYNEFFRSVLPSRIKYLFEVPKFWGKLKNNDAEGHVVGYFNLTIIDFNIVEIEDIFRGLIIGAEELLIQNEVSTKGVVVIIDCRGIGFHHAKVFTPSRIQFLFNIFLGTYPVKYKGFHVLYDSFVFDPLLKLFKMFAPKKIRERIFLHGRNPASLHKNFSPAILPDWLEGELSLEDCFDYDFEDRLFSLEDYYKRLALKWG